MYLIGLIFVLIVFNFVVAVLCALKLSGDADDKAKEMREQEVEE